MGLLTGSLDPGKREEERREADELRRLREDVKALQARAPAREVSPSQWIVGQRWSADAEAKRQGYHETKDETLGERAARSMKVSVAAKERIRQRAVPPIETLATKTREDSAEIAKAFEMIDLGKVLERQKIALQNFFLRNPNTLAAVRATKAITDIYGKMAELAQNAAAIARKIDIVATAVGLGDLTADLRKIAEAPSIAVQLPGAIRGQAVEMAGAAAIAGLTIDTAKIKGIVGFITDYEKKEIEMRNDLRTFRDKAYVPMFGSVLGDLMGE